MLPVVQAHYFSEFLLLLLFLKLIFRYAAEKKLKNNKWQILYFVNKTSTNVKNVQYFKCILFMIYEALSKLLENSERMKKVFLEVK